MVRRKNMAHCNRKNIFFLKKGADILHSEKDGYSIK